MPASDTDDAENLASGAMAGLVAECIMHPIDTLNTRLKVFAGGQAPPSPLVQPGKSSLHVTGLRGTPSSVLHYTHPAAAAPPGPAVLKYLPQSVANAVFQRTTMTGVAVHVVRTEGWRALFDGLPATVLLSMPSTAVYFAAYEWVKRVGEGGYTYFADAAQWLTGVRPDMELGYMPAVYCFAGAFGELASSSVYVPQEVVKTRMQMGANPRESTGGWIKNSANYRSTFEAVSLIWRGEGLRGFYASWRASVTLDCSYSAAQFMLYELLKKRAQRARVRNGETTDENDELPLHTTLWIGTVAGGVGAGLTNPLGVVATRMMVQGHTLPPGSPGAALPPAAAAAAAHSTLVTTTMMGTPPRATTGSTATVPPRAPALEGGQTPAAPPPTTSTAPAGQAPRPVAAAAAATAAASSSSASASVSATAAATGGAADASSAAERLVRESMHSSSRWKQQRYTQAVVGSLGQVLRDEGVVGLLRGITPRMAYNAPMAALSFVVYEAGKQWFTAARDPETVRRKALEENDGCVSE
jgi:hypothetical protein